MKGFVILGEKIERVKEFIVDSLLNEKIEKKKLRNKVKKIKKTYSL